ncbi:energy transducer TonB [Ferrimonas balearica]|uniref:energy transducer TonB n=1 Tax=Ferrimonas balearica TaxID=44012 RepID=UPI001C998951|nr:energy transducer TonB [Ferrimonas balearica]MBY5992439.1 energy transducer TonB [Ferrimonas balearica]
MNAVFLNARRTLALTLTLFLTTPAQAQDPDQVYQAFGEYQQALAADDPVQTAEHAERAYHLAQVHFADDDVQTAMLAMNWGSALEALSQHRPADRDDALYQAHRQAHLEMAQQAYREAIAHYETALGPQALELVDPLLASARLASTPKEKTKAFDRALTLTHANPLLKAEIGIQAYDALHATSERSQQRQAKRYLNQALGLYQAQLPENDVRLINARYRQGQLHYAQGERVLASEVLEQVVAQYDGLDYSHPIALSARTLLVDLYERRGKRAQATAHCVAIGQMRPWSENQEQAPLFRVAPGYPTEMARRGKEGMVILDLVIDAQGFVAESRVRESTGGKAFERSAIKALEGWRYAPRFEDGEPVAAETMVRLDFSLNRGRS